MYIPSCTLRTSADNRIFRIQTDPRHYKDFSFIGPLVRNNLSFSGNMLTLCLLLLPRYTVGSPVDNSEIVFKMCFKSAQGSLFFLLFFSPFFFFFLFFLLPSYCVHPIHVNLSLSLSSLSLSLLSLSLSLSLSLCVGKVSVLCIAAKVKKREWQFLCSVTSKIYWTFSSVMLVCV